MSNAIRILAVLGLILALLGGCTFDATQLEERRCRSDGDCPATWTCLGGFCQDDGAGNNGINNGDEDTGPDDDAGGNNGLPDADNNGQEDTGTNNGGNNGDDTGNNGQPDATNNGAGCAVDSDCDDDLFCNGVETCDPADPSADADGCVRGVAPMPDDDGIDCTDPSCDEDTDTVANVVTNRCACDTPGELCDDPDTNDCTLLRCSDDLNCVEEDAALDTPCNDGVNCTTTDLCNANGTCLGSPNDAFCSNQRFCDGAEACAPGAPGANGDGCILGEAPMEDDGVDCTVDVCNEANDNFDHIPSNCGCDTDAECIPATPNPCLAYSCGTDSRCTSTPRDNTTSCNDGRDCTTNDRCDGAGGCAGSPDDTRCNDRQFCNGVETCQPDSPLANGLGCLDGPDPAEDDGIACTVDVCNETNDDFDHIRTNCGCLNDAECIPTPANDCLNYTCGANQQCVTTPKLVTDTCSDGFDCTTNDHCNGAGGCEGSPTNALCDNMLYCDGVETCAPTAPGALASGCLPGTDPLDDVSAFSCAVVTCNETTDMPDIDASACECAAANDCTDPCLTNASCVDGMCVGTIVIGSECTLTCANNVAGSAGTCTATGCEVPPEGPTGVASCGDLRDNDCDGAVDDSDSDCFIVDAVGREADPTAPPAGPPAVPAGGDLPDNDCYGAVDDSDSDCFIVDAVGLEADTTATTGIAGPGARLTATPTDTGAAATAQDANLYCTGRIRAHHLDLGALRTNNLPNNVTLGNTTDIRTNQTWNGARGIDLCEGNSLVFGPLTMPANDTATKYTFAVNVRMGNQGDSNSQLDNGEYLLVSVKHSGTGSKFLPIVAIGDNRDQELHDYTFLVPNTATNNTLEIRLEIMTDDGNYSDTCAFVESIDVYDVRNPTIGQQTDWVQWTVNGNEGNAVETFMGQSNGYFATFFASRRSGVDFVYTVEGNAASDGDGKGAKYRTDESGSNTDGRTGWVQFPVPTGPPANYDRANPLMFDLNMRTERTEWAEDEWGHATLSVAGANWYKLGSAVPVNIASSTYAVSYTPANRYSFILPESAKTLDLATRLENDSYSNTDERLQVDYIHFYSYSGHADDITIIATPSAEGAGAYTYELRSARSGEVEVQCVWQVPEEGTFTTILSDPAYVTFSP